MILSQHVVKIHATNFVAIFTKTLKEAISESSQVNARPKLKEYRNIERST